MDVEDLLGPDDGKEVVLTDEQWEKVKAEWNKQPKNPPSISDLVFLLTGDKTLDGRSKIGRAIRKALADASLKAKTTKFVPVGALELTDAQKEYIDNNYVTNSIVEMARILFSNNGLTNLSQEARTIAEYVKVISPEDKGVKDIPAGDYFPPRSIEGVLKKINKYRTEQIEKDKLTGKQKKDLAALLGYLNTLRFKSQISSYSKNKDRELFEDTYIRYTYDKFDLTEEEVDQYVVLCSEIITAAEIQIRKEMLNKLLTESMESEDKKVSMSVVESIETASTEHDKCLARTAKLLDSLKIKRSEKEGKGKDASASIINLVQLWKDEESRLRMIKFAEQKKEKLKKGAEDLMSMDELKARIVGLDMDTILNG